VNIPEYSDAQFRRIVDHSRDALLVIDDTATIRFASRACDEVFGYAADALIGTSGLDLIHPDDVEHAVLRLVGSFDHSHEMQPAMRVRCRMANGEYRWVETRSQFALPDPELGGVVLNVRDVHEQVLAEQELVEAKERLAYLAHHDSLTGLANRSSCVQHLDEVCARRHVSDGPAFVLFIDVDNFKDVNDRFGHAAGDAVLVAIASRMRRAVRSSDFVARLGGDEFVIICEGATADGMRRSLERVAAAMADPVACSAGEIRVTVSTGVTVVEPGQVASDVLSRADHAMYEAKGRGGNQWTGAAASGV